MKELRLGTRFDRVPLYARRRKLDQQLASQERGEYQLLNYYFEVRLSRIPASEYLSSPEISSWVSSGALSYEEASCL